MAKPRPFVAPDPVLTRDDLHVPPMAHARIVIDPPRGRWVGATIAGVVFVLAIAVAFAAIAWHFELEIPPPSIAQNARPTVASQECVRSHIETELVPAGMAIDGVQVGGLRYVNRRHCDEWRAR